MNTEDELVRVTEIGRMGIGTANPSHELHLIHGSFGATNTNNGLKIHNNGSNDNNWTLYTYNGSGNLGLFFGTVLTGSFNDATGAYTAISDRRFKKNIESAPSLLPAVMDLKPRKYHFKNADDSGPKYLGFIAQEAMVQFPELVDEIGEEEMYYAVDYAGFSVVAIKAIQEQQEIIEAQQAVIEDLTKRLEQVERQLRE